MKYSKSNKKISSKSKKFTADKIIPYKGLFFFLIRFFEHQ